MSDDGADSLQGPGPNEMRDPLVRTELKKATVWLGLAVAIGLVVLLIQPLLLIFAGLVFAAMLDGGVRLLGRVLPIGRGWRLAIVALSATAFIVGTFILAGVEITQQAAQLRATIEVQGTRILDWLNDSGLMPEQANVGSMVQQALGSLGRVTMWVGSAFGALASAFMVIVIGLFVAMEPRLYERGVAWLVPSRERDQFHITMQRMGYTMRRLLAGRLLGMLVEGVLTWIALSIGGVPMALLLGILTGLLAFIPNIGAFVSGLLMVAVGFSAGVDTGLWAIGTYVLIQTFDGYVLIPMVAKKTVDLPPALTLGSQILASALMGFLGLMLADPLVAMIKVALERQSEREIEKAERRKAAP
jgi:predicted PurR-regulated permease PerM